MSSKSVKPPFELDPASCLGPFDERLRALAPSVVYALGEVELLARGPRVAILGPRRPSVPAIKSAVWLVEELAADGVVLVSGLSEGLHMAVHGAALDCGARCIAVLATGHDVCFPKLVEYLQRTLAHKQLVLSSLPRPTMASRETFARRDALLALCADAAVVLEAQAGSGTLASARAMLRAGRALFLAPSIFEDPRQSWAGELLAQGARVMKQASEVLDVLPERGPS